MLLAGGASIAAVTFLIISATFGPGLLPPSHSSGQVGGHNGNSTRPGPSTNPNVISVDTLVNYGNGTSIWYNETNVPIGSNFYSLTLQIGNANFISESLGHFLVSINGVSSNGSGSNCSICWGIWIYCARDDGWMYSLLGADLLKLNNGDVLAWYLHDISQNQPPEGSKPPLTTCSA